MNRMRKTAEPMSKSVYWSGSRYSWSWSGFWSGSRSGSLSRYWSWSGR
jgi:hypothetical protein